MCVARSLFLFALLVTSLDSRAQGAGAFQFSAGPTLTGTGVGIGATLKTLPVASVSAEFSVAPFSARLDLGEIEDIAYDVDLSIWSLSLMGHVYPFGSVSGFALGAGVLLGGYGFEGTGTPQDDTEIGRNTYTAEELGTADAEFRLGGPALVLELGRRGRGFNIGAGVIIPAHASAELLFNGPVAGEPGFQADLEAELEDIEDEVEIIPALPFLRIGYQFGF